MVGDYCSTIDGDLDNPAFKRTCAQTDQNNVLVTPQPLNNQVLSTEAAKAVVNRQLTMQLMPMYRIRQRSAGLKPNISNQTYTKD